MADPPKLSTDPHSDPARRLPQLAPVSILVALVLNLALCLRRGGGGGVGGRDLGFVGLSHLNLLLLFLSLRRFERTTPGSAARGQATFAVWLLTATLTAAFTWKMAALMPLGLAVAAWAVAAATVLGGFYVLFLIHGDK